METTIAIGGTYGNISENSIMLNLEPFTTQAATRMVGADTLTALNLITQSLRVVTEQGLFALGLFLVTRQPLPEVKAATDIHQAITDLLHQAELAPEAMPPLSPDYYRNLTKVREQEDSVTALQRILLTKQLVETALIHGRLTTGIRYKKG